MSAIGSADVPKILALDADLALTVSELQVQIVADLVRAGVAVQAFNQRDVAGIFAMIRSVGAWVGAEAAEALSARPRWRVYIEEWDAPLISGIGWVSDLVRIDGGGDISADLGRRAAAKDRIVAPEAVVDAAPEVLMAS